MQRIFLKKALSSCLLLTLLGGLVGLSVARAGGASDDRFMMVSIASPSANMKAVTARMTIQAPPNLVWQDITNYGQLKNILPGYEKSTVVNANGPNKMVDIVMRVARLLPAYSYRVLIHENPSRRQLSMNRISGDFKSLYATYQLIPQDNGRKTLLVYNLNIDPGNNLPGTQTILKNNAERSLGALHQYIEQQYRKSVIGTN